MLFKEVIRVNHRELYETQIQNAVLLTLKSRWCIGFKGSCNIKYYAHTWMRIIDLYVFYKAAPVGLITTLITGVFFSKNKISLQNYTLLGFLCIIDTLKHKTQLFFVSNSKPRVTY
jgi:hypothetical protein